MQKASVRKAAAQRDVYFQVEWASGEVTEEPSDMLRDGAEGVIADFFQRNPTAPGPPIWFCEAKSSARPGDYEAVNNRDGVHVEEARSFG